MEEKNATQVSFDDFLLLIVEFQEVDEKNIKELAKKLITVSIFNEAEKKTLSESVGLVTSLYLNLLLNRLNFQRTIFDKLENLNNCHGEILETEFEKILKMLFCFKKIEFYRSTKIDLITLVEGYRKNKKKITLTCFYMFLRALFLCLRKMLSLE